MLFRWVSEADLVAFYEGLVAADLAESGAGKIADVTACPGTDTCKLGISSSRGLAAELRRQLKVVTDAPDASEALHVKCSGCFNACGQHHVADIGFLGVSRQVGTRKVAHFQLVVGGEWTHNAGSYGLGLGAIPSKNVPQVVERLRLRFVKEKNEGELFKDFVNRIGKKQVRTMLEDLMEVPPYEVDKSYYADWGDPREYTIGDQGEGECAGEVVAFAIMGLAAAEREVFEAQLLADEGNAEAANQKSYRSMITAAQAITREVFPNLSDDPDEIVNEFRTRLVEPQIFHDPFAGAKFAQQLYRAHETRGVGASNKDLARQNIEEAQTFVDAAYQAYERLQQQRRTQAAE
jgi:sulfite reductase (ferredoxin)